MATATALMTTEDLLALPDDGVERWLINGELREQPMSYRNRFHCRVMTRVAKFLDNWLDEQPQPRGQILTGDAGVRLSLDPETMFGLDVAYVSADLLDRQTEESTVLTGVPILAAKILSPNDRIEDINDKIDALLRAEAPQVWILDPRRRTVTVYRPGAAPAFYHEQQEMTAEPEMPGFRVAVARLFE